MADSSSTYRGFGFGVVAGVVALIPLHLALSIDPGVATILLVLGAGILIAVIRGFRHQPQPGSREGFAAPGTRASAAFTVGIAAVLAAGSLLAPNAAIDALRPTKQTKAAIDGPVESSAATSPDEDLAALVTAATTDNASADAHVVSVAIGDWGAELAVSDPESNTITTYYMSTGGPWGESSPAADDGVRTFVLADVTATSLYATYRAAILAYGGEDYYGETPPSLVITADEDGQPSLGITLDEGANTRTIEIAADGTIPRAYDPTDTGDVLDEAQAVLSEAGVEDAAVNELIFQVEGRDYWPIAAVTPSPLGDRAGLLITVASGSVPTAYVEPVGRFADTVARPPGGLQSFFLADIPPAALSAIISDYSANLGYAAEYLNGLSVRISIEAVNTTPEIVVNLKYHNDPSARYLLDGTELN